MDSSPVPYSLYERMYEKAVANEDLNKAGGEFYMIQANLPDSWPKYRSGNGEGIWAIIDEPDLDKWHRNVSTGTFFAVPCVMSVYFPGWSMSLIDQQKSLITPVEFEFRGEKRPVLNRKTLETLIGKR
jgi:hypothetical protein